MNNFLRLSELSLGLRVNGVEIDWARLRQCGKLETELELVVMDPVLGDRNAANDSTQSIA